MESQGIAHKGSIHVVGKQHPVLLSRHTQNLYLFVQHQRIGLLAPVPGGIAAAADVAAKGIQHHGPLLVQNLYLRWEPGLFVPHPPSVGYVDNHNRKASRHRELFLAGLRHHGLLFSVLFLRLKLQRILPAPSQQDR